MSHDHRVQRLRRVILEDLLTILEQRTTQRSDDAITKRFLLEVADCPGRLDPLSFVGRLASSEDCFERYELTEGKSLICYGRTYCPCQRAVEDATRKNESKGEKHKGLERR